MNKYLLSDIQNLVEEKSRQCTLLMERFINASDYTYNLTAIKQGLEFLGISHESLRVFEKRTDFVVWLGRRLADYDGYELPLFIGHTKMGLPVPDALVEKCPHAIVGFIKNMGKQRFIQDYTKELGEIISIFFARYISVCSPEHYDLPCGEPFARFAFRY